MNLPAQIASRALLLLVLVPAPACKTGAPAERPPRGILLITVDTLRADHLGCYGDDERLTPRMDQLAAEGVRFPDAMTPVPITLPAHTSLMTGSPPPVHGVRDNGAFRLGPEMPTLAGRLAAAGWPGGAFIGAVVLDAAFGLDRGFERYDDDIRVPVGGPGSGVASYPERPAVEVVDAALAWIGDRPGDGRFFAWVHLFDPHAPYAPPDPTLAHTYRGEVAYADRQIGRLLDGLRQQGRADDLLVVLTADHGEGLGEHGETTHGFFLYQSTVQVPLILWSPGRLAAGVVVDQSVDLLDVAPTILDLAGLPALPEAIGRSLAPVAAGGELMERAHYLETYLPYFQMRWSGSRGLRLGPRKYLHGTSPELYDLSSDPHEENDLSGPDASGAQRLGDELLQLAAELNAVRAAAAGRPQLDGKAEAQLRTLGYLSGGSAGPDDLAAAAARRPDTRERIHLVDALLEAAPAAIDRAEPEGLRRLAELAGQDPDNPRLLTLHGKALLTQGRPGEALVPLRRAVAIDPEDPRLHANLATALLRLDRPEEAGASLDTALALEPGDPEVRRQHGALLLDAGDPLRAESTFRDVLQGNPGDLGALRGLGRSLAAQGRWPEAANALDRFLAGAPDAVDELVLAGTAAVRVQDGSRAEARFRRALELRPDSLGALLGLGLVLGERGDDLGAAQILQQAVRAAPGDPRALTPFAVAAARVGDLDTARRALRHSLRLDPDQPVARDLLQQLGG